MSLCGINPADALHRTYPRGTTVRDTEEDNGFVVFLAEGSVEVYSVAPDSREVCVSNLKEGECFGIANLFEPSELGTVIKCKTACVTLYIPKEILRRAILENVEAAIEYARICNRKIQFLIRRIERLTMQSCRAKLAEYLLSAGDAEGEVRAKCSKEVLARILGVSRAAVFREISFLREKGLISTQGNRMFIENKQALEKLV